MNEDEKSPWLPVIQSQVSSNKEGKLMMALSIGEEVMIAFQGDLTCRPYVLGALCRGNDMNLLADKDKTAEKEEGYDRVY